MLIYNDRCSQADRGEELSKVRSAETSDGIPALLRRETIGVAARVGTRRDVVEGCNAVGVQERVEEAERALARCNKPVVDKRDDGRERGRCAGGTIDPLHGAIDDNLEVHTLRGDVGVPTTGRVVLAGVGAAER